MKSNRFDSLILFRDQWFEFTSVSCKRSLRIKYIKLVKAVGVVTETRLLCYSKSTSIIIIIICKHYKCIVIVLFRGR